MHVTSVKIRSIKAIRDVEWTIEAERAAGWHTILGVNASGKSTFVKSVAAALIGPRECFALKQDWKAWVRQGQTDGSVDVWVDESSPWDPKSGPTLCPLQFDSSSGLSTATSNANFAELTKWGNFSAGFGPFRRFTGGGLEFERELESTPILARHISAFDERAALSSALEWLRQQRFVALETQAPDQSSLVQNIIDFVNQDGFLPGGAKLSSITSSGIEFTDANAATVNVLEMSDGFRSILSLAFELIRLLHRTYSESPVGNLFSFQDDGSIVVDVEGVVLIDEVDAHLHPTWQRSIGPWFTKHFPRMQFMVTTHSPFVCQASSNGTIFVLHNDGEGVTGRFLEGKERDRILYGDILDAYSTEVFGGGMTRSDESKDKFSRLAQLNSKSLFNPLSNDEIQEREMLQQTMSTEPSPLESL